MIWNVHETDTYGQNHKHFTAANYGLFRAIGGGKVVEHLTHYPTIEGSNSVAGTGRDKHGDFLKRYNLLGCDNFSHYLNAKSDSRVNDHVGRKMFMKLTPEQFYKTFFLVADNEAN